MSKGLESLKVLKECRYHFSKEWNENYPIVEKELKALNKIVELIKEMGYSLENLGNDCFCFSIDCYVSISEQTFNLLKEVLL